MGPILYLLYTADLPTTKDVTIGTFADDTAVLAAHNNPTKASELLQASLKKIKDWMHTWHIKANETKFIHVTFTTRRGTCPPVTLNGLLIAQQDEVRYLGLHFDRRLTWKKHVFTKRKQLEFQFRKMYWLIGRNSRCPWTTKYSCTRV